MRGTVRLGAIGLVIGTILMATAPTDAKAITPISLFELESFPASLLGEGPPPENGIVVAFHENNVPWISAFLFDSEFHQVRDHLIGLLPTFGLFIAFNEGGLQIWPFAFDEDGLGYIGFPPANGAPGGGSGGSDVTTAPEPATWIMMIAGFWIVAWRLRQRRRNIRGLLAAPA